MGGHSHWAGIKHKKGIADAKRGKVFTRIAREITIAAKMGGGNPDHNPRLRKAITDANAANMPKENVKRAIQRGTGELPGLVFEECTYEGYAPGGVAVFAEGTTDNKNRTIVEIRRIFEDHGGNLGAAGAVGWMFSAKGSIKVPKEATQEDDLLAVALDAGGEDLRSDDPDNFEVLCAPNDLDAVKTKLEAAGQKPSSAEIVMIPSSTVAVGEKDARKVLELIDELEGHDDVKSVYSNFDIPDEVMAKLEA